MLPSKAEMDLALRVRHGTELQTRFSNAVVAVCGLGGLGSNIALSLVRAGVGKLILIDFDRVDITNLHRQQYKASQVGMYKTDASLENLREVNPYAELVIHTAYIDENSAVDILSSADIICEAFDSAEAKAMLADVVAERMPDKYYVSSSGMAGIGSPNGIKTRRIAKRFYICGDFESEVAEGGGLFSTRVMLCAAHQAHTVLRILAGEFEV